MSDLTDKLKKKLEGVDLTKEQTKKILKTLISAGTLAADVASMVVTKTPAGITRQINKIIKEKKEKKTRVEKSKMTSDDAYKLKKFKGGLMVKPKRAKGGY
jgi:N-glycosylase/DNA lyase